MKRIILVLTVIASVVVIGPRLIVLAVGTWDYFYVAIDCYGESPTPPKGLGSSVPFPLFEVKPYAVITNRGYMIPGDEYEIAGEGDWLGMVTLLWAGANGSYFIVDYESVDQSEGYARARCRWYSPIVDFR